MTNNSIPYEEVNYIESFVAYLDILGFTNLVMSGKDEDTEKIRLYFGIVDSQLKEISTIPIKSKIQSIVVSDSVILSIPQSGVLPEDLNILRHLCITVGIIQQKLAKNNIWLRGGISSGKSYFNDLNKQIVGPAHIKAYKLEHELAKTPRVILDSKIIGELGFSTAADFIDAINNKADGGLHFINWSANILFYWHQELIDPGNYIEQDLPLFIDYLSPNIDMKNNEIKLVIENIKSSIYQDVSVYGKYRWVANYLKSMDLGKNIEINVEEIENLLANI
ncbi:MAG TPA: hypothetical protein DIW44_15210 [Anaerolineaceae bacterium]|nr:hypothetical protein [Anaerolineaceae bacterium]